MAAQSPQQHLRGPRRPHAAGDLGAARAWRDVRAEARRAFRHKPACSFQAPEGPRACRAHHAWPGRAEAPLPNRCARSQGSRPMARGVSPALGRAAFFAPELPTKSAKPHTKKISGRKIMAVKNSIDLERDPRSIIGSRQFDAPRALVFSVWTDPRHLAQWWGPNGFTTTTHAYDFRPGGVWRFVMHGPDGRDYHNRITFDEIVPPDRIVYRHGGGDDVEPGQFTQTVTFEDLADGKPLLTSHARFPSAEERARVIKEYGADKGLAQTMARLADYPVTMPTEKSA